MTDKIQRKKLIKNIACAFFISLALINVIADLINGLFKIIDFVFLAITIIPVLISKQWFYKLYGTMGALVFAFFFLAIMISHIDGVQKNSADPIVNYLMGYVFTLVGLASSVMLIYVGFYNIDEEEIQTELTPAEAN